VTEGFLRRAYHLDTQEETNAYYSQWASSYDAELTGQGYQTPARCAAALLQFVDTNATILDIGCGTGLSGRALATAGYAHLAGNDVNEQMLVLARQAGVYGTVSVTDVENPFPFEPGTYDAITAVGVIGVGAAPLSVFHEALHALAPGGHFCFSFNEHALKVPEFPAAIEAATSSGIAEVLFAQDGPHIEGLASTSTVYVLRRS